MKKAKRILAVFLAALLLAAAVPMNAFAATMADTINLTVNAEPGMPVEDFQQYITINSDGVKYLDDEDLPVMVGEVYEGEYYYYEDYEFNFGSTYVLYIFLQAASGYTMPVSKSQMKAVTVNGEDVDFEIEEYGDELVFVLCYEFETENQISKAEVVVKPYGGFNISDFTRYVEIVSPGVMFEETLDTGVIVYDSENVTEDEYFEAGKEYTLEICLAPDYGCEFIKDENCEIALDSVTVNGVPAEYSACIENDRGYIEYIVLLVDVVPVEAICIDKIELTILEDIAGYAVDDYEEYITINTPGVIYDKYDPYAVWAYSGSIFEEVEEYGKGDYYYIVLNFIADEGYYLSPDGVTVYVNGEEVCYCDLLNYEPEGARVDYVYMDYETDIQGTFFDIIIAFFKNIFQILFGWLI